jgi:hypothetical protein
VVEIVDGVLQLLENILLVLALAGDVTDDPAGMTVGADRTHPDPVPAGPACAPADAARHANFLRGAAALLGGDGEPVNRFRRIRIVGEEALDGMQVARTLRAGEFQESGVGRARSAVRRGDQHALCHVVHKGAGMPTLFDRRLHRAAQRQNACSAGKKPNNADCR